MRLAADVVGLDAFECRRDEPAPDAAVDVARLLTVCPPGSVPVLSAKFAPF